MKGPAGCSVRGLFLWKTCLKTKKKAFKHRATEDTERNKYMQVKTHV